MSTLYDRIQKSCENAGISVSAMCLELGMSKSTMSDLKAGRKKSLTSDTVTKIAAFLGVSTDSLLTDTEKAPAENGERAVNDDDIKFALFGGDGEITDDMYDEVRRFAAFVKQREEQKKEQK